MTSDPDRFIDPAADPAHRTIDTSLATTEDHASGVGRIVTDTINKARPVIEGQLDRLRSAYNDNPTRVLTIGAVCLAGLTAILTTLTRRD